MAASRLSESSSAPALQEHAAGDGPAAPTTEQHFRAIFDSTYPFMGLLQTDGTLVEVNQAALDFGGLTRDEVVGRPFWECRWWLTSAETQAQLRTAIERAAHGELVRYEVEVLGAAGIRTPIDFSIKPIVDEDDRVIFLLPEGRDVSALKQARTEGLEQAHDLAIFTERLKQLHRLSTTRYDHLDDLLEDYLRTGCSILKLEVGVLNHVAGRHCVFDASFPQAAGFQRGSEYDISEMLCEAVIQQRKTVSYADVEADDDLREHPAYLNLHVRSYIGTPIYVAGSLYGVLLFVSGQPHRSFGAQDREIVEMMAESVGRFIEYHHAEREREEARQELVKEREFLQAVLDNIEEGIVACDAEGRITLFNQATRTFHGLPAEPLLPHQWAAHYDLYRRDGTPLPTEEVPLYRVWQGGSIRGDEIRIVPGEGPARTLVVNGQSLVAADGTRLGAVVAMHDITERLEAEQRLLDHQRQLNRAQEIAHLGSWNWDVQTDALSWSDELYCIYGLEPGAPVTRAVMMRYIHEEDREAVRAHLDEAYTTRTPFHFHHRIVRPDGEERMLRADGEMVVGGDGEVVKVIGTAHDVTDRRQAEERLRLLEAAVSASLDGITIADMNDPDEPLVYVSPGFERMTGYAVEEVLGRNCRFLQGDDRDQPVVETIRAAIRDGRQCRVTLRNYRRDGSLFWNELTLYPLHDADGTLSHYVGIQRDVTERKQAEQELARINAKLEQRNRELQDFAYVASHDLQEPLRKIRAFADLMKEDYDEQLDDTGRYYLDRMQDAAARMSRLISDLLAYSRVTTKARPFDRVDLNQVAAEVLSDLEVQLSEVEGSIDIDDLPTIEADSTQMRQLLQNFIANALKFYREGVRPVVEVRACVETSEALGPMQPLCRLEVRDNGIGFDEKYLDRIFTPFQRLHGRGAYAGTGMGLAICRRIVERHQGAITARSTPGEGTTFIVTLPMHQHNTDQEEDAS